MVNRNFGDIENGTHLVFAPAPLVASDGKTYQNPTAEIYAANVPPYWPVVEVHPDPQTGYHEEEAAPTKVQVIPGEPTSGYEIHRNWTLVVNPTPPTIYRAWTPLTIMRGAKTGGFWTAVKTVLEQNDAYDEFMACQYCAECDPSFISIKAIIVSQIGEEATEEFLNSLKIEKTGTREELLEMMA